ncbi:LANO_0H02828g1_1 [Lachancea nothofagi CBS 11611]|uniref:LANO_0H02828g1_1 n=1 Tax=Lachancea nothofagi CBS 11611 TaxID=1266666 RepID=A0A1G4KLD6_9SACH|nr:LANO_0H02828g1_1 [Lachancea nothofagi CBS 11611]
MSKRVASIEDANDADNARVVSSKLDSNAVPTTKAPVAEGDVEMGEFEDQFSDEFESDGEIVQMDGEEDEEENVEGEVGGEDGEYIQRSQLTAQQLVDQDQASEQKQSEPQQQLYLPHLSKPLGPDEVLEADPTVYEMLHNVNMPWPCLTLDIIPDRLGSERRNYPQSLLMTTATQATKKKDNELLCLKLSQLSKTLVKDDNNDEDDDDDDEDEDQDPVMENENVPLKDTTNRLRVSPFASESPEKLTATMSESGEVHIFDLGPQVKAFEVPGYQIPKTAKRPIHTIKNHGSVEGYALDWSPLHKSGSLLTGDCSGRVYLTQRHTSKWITDKTAFSADNNQSIEDIQFSRTEATVFATAGCDGYIRIWDTRSKKHKPAISVQASNTDVNVISWNEKIGYLLASGDDNGTWGVWDLRQFAPSTAASTTPVAQYSFHKGAITSIAFNPLDDSIIAVASEDNTVTLWDLSVEADDEEIKQQAAETAELQQIPPQLLFVHWQKEVKDVKWHKQIPGCLVSTGTDGLNVWKTISV